MGKRVFLKTTAGVDPAATLSCSYYPKQLLISCFSAGFARGTGPSLLFRPFVSQRPLHTGPLCTCSEVCKLTDFSLVWFPQHTSKSRPSSSNLTAFLKDAGSQASGVWQRGELAGDKSWCAGHVGAGQLSANLAQRHARFQVFYVSWKLDHT